MKKVVLILMGVLGIIFLSNSSFAQTIICKIGDSTPKTYSYAPAFAIFEKEVEEKTGQKVDVQYFGDGVLGDQKTITESCLMGAIQMVVIPSTISQNFVAEHRLFTLPFLWPNYEILRRYLDSKEGKDFGDLWRRNGLKFLAYGHIGWIGIQNSKREVKTPPDLKGLKIRTMPDSVLVDTMNALGAMGVSMGIPELYSAVQQGVLDGVSTSAQFLYSLKIHEVAKYYIHLKVQTSPAIVLINLKFWNSLSPDIQKVFLEASKNWEKNNDAYYVDNSKKTSDDNIMGFFKELGVKIYDPSKAETEPFRKLTIPVFNKYRNQIGPALVDKVAKFTGYKAE
jgi:tripartite ATP-independent transporter DctP family solute receptor